MEKFIEFLSHGYKIRGEIHLVDGEATPHTVLLLHGFPGNVGDVLNLGQRLSRCGFNTLVFNYRGTHGSEGTFSLQNTIEDIQAAYAYLHQEQVLREFNLNPNELILGGYSYGGGMALAYAANHPEIKRVFSISGTDHGELAREYERNSALAERISVEFDEMKGPSGPVRLEFRTFKELIQDLSRYDLKLAATALANRDILLIGGWDDFNVMIEHHVLPFYRALVEAKAQKVQIAAFQDNHAFEKSREELAAIVTRWIKSS